MSVVPWPDHLMTLDEWNALPEDNRFRYELVEGILIVSPRPVAFHQRAVTRLGYLIDEQLPDELAALSDVELIINAGPPPTVRAPDVIAASAKVVEDNPARLRPGDVRLAVEVLSQGSRRTDRVMKLSEYAEVGIPHHWLVDLAAPTTLTRFQLVNGSYKQLGEHTGLVTVEIDGAPVTLNLDALTTRRAQKL